MSQSVIHLRPSKADYQIIKYAMKYFDLTQTEVLRKALSGYWRNKLINEQQRRKSKK